MTLESGDQVAVVFCPRCQSKRVWKDGLRKMGLKPIQRYTCKDCRYRFSEGTVLNGPFPLIDRQVCAHLDGSKNLTVVTEKRTTGDTSDIKSTLFEYTWYLKKEGYTPSTIETRYKLLRVLSNRGADLLDPESVKETIAAQKWVNKRKINAADAYAVFLRMKGLEWNPPRYRAIQKLPFIPAESEIDALISGCGPITSIFLQLLKETAMRAGEAHQLIWKDVDFESNTIRVTPEKGSNPRIFKLSKGLVSRLQRLNVKKQTKEVFGKYLRNRRRLFQKQRATLARKLENPRLLEIKFHTFRHWKATMLYHQTKDLLFVQRFLGHRSVQNTLKYIQLDAALFEDQDEQYVCKAASNVDDAMSLIELGFEHVCDFNGVKLFRKRS